MKCIQSLCFPLRILVRGLAPTPFLFPTHLAMLLSPSMRHYCLTGHDKSCDEGKFELDNRACSGAQLACSGAQPTFSPHTLNVVALKEDFSISQTALNSTVADAIGPFIRLLMLILLGSWYVKRISSKTLMPLFLGAGTTAGCHHPEPKSGGSLKCRPMVQGGESPSLKA